MFQSVFSLAQQCAEMRGAVLRQFIDDDKGAVLIYNFNLRHTILPHAAARAVLFCLELVDVLGGWGPAVGLSYGNSYCGVVGDGVRAEYTVMSGWVNLAARLMGVSAKHGGGVTVDMDTVRAAGKVEGVRFVGGGEVRVKGFEGDVKVWAAERDGGKGQGEREGGMRGRRLSSQSSMGLSTNRPVVFVGRRAERQSIIEAAKKCFEGANPKTIVVKGEGGIGKSSLAGAVVRELREERGEAIFVARGGQAYGVGFPLR